MRGTDSEPFYAELAVAEYREMIAMRNAETTALGKADCAEIARLMRARWAAWQGEDSLHSMAFGEPTNWTATI